MNLSKLLTILFLLTLTYSFSQDNKFIDDETSLYLETNINFATSTEDSRPDSQAGTGTLGIKFKRKFLYGGVRFTVFSKNDEIISESNTDNKIF